MKKIIWVFLLSFLTSCAIQQHSNLKQIDCKSQYCWKGKSISKEKWDRKTMRVIRKTTKNFS